jgi:hypothetical protein
MLAKALDESITYCPQIPSGRCRVVAMIGAHCPTPRHPSSTEPNNAGLWPQVYPIAAQKAAELGRSGVPLAARCEAASDTSTCDGI